MLMLREVCEKKLILPNEEQLQSMLSSAAESAAIATASSFLINSNDFKQMVRLKNQNEKLNEKLEISHLLNWGFVGLFTPIFLYAVSKTL